MDPHLLNTAIKIRALQNAIRHRGKADRRAVIAKLIGDYPELRARALAISSSVDTIIAEVNVLTLDSQRELLKELAPEMLHREEPQRDERSYLPELPHHDQVIMRFAPNPNGPATLGSARGIVVNSEYARRYDGQFVLRFDDTDPQTKRPLLEAYIWYKEDCEWLGAIPSVVVNASDHMETYYRYADKLIAKGAAYVCTCPQERLKMLKESGLACPDRDNSPKQNLALWKKMLDGHFSEREAVLRIKTDITHKNPALRDWIGFRIVNRTHPRGLKFRVWPLLDFESAVEDHELGVTHIIRGKDLRDSEKRQKFLYEHLGWMYPFTLHWGRISVHEFGKFSTSTLKKQISEGLYSGWDDPRLPTLRALRRRGFAPEAIRRFILKLGVNESDISVSLENLYAENRKIIDPIARRYFFVKDPILMRIAGGPATVAHAPLHPAEPQLYREIPIEAEVYVSAQDITFSPGSLVRLKDLYNVRMISKDPLEAEYAGHELIRGMKIIHWAPPEGPLVKVLTPSGVDSGVGEIGIESELDNVVQFERYGFARVDRVEHNTLTTITCYFTHK